MSTMDTLRKREKELEQMKERLKYSAHPDDRASIWEDISIVEEEIEALKKSLRR